MNSNQLSEKELRLKVETFISHFSQEYLLELNLDHEYYLSDDRAFRKSNKRRLDSVFNNGKFKVAVEFKRGILTEKILDDCGFIRGYYELCNTQIPNFSMFLYVAEDVTKAKELCKEILTPPNITITCLTYTDYIFVHAKRYAVWASNNNEKTSIVLQNLLNAKESLPENWFTEKQLTATIKYLSK